MIGYGLMKAGGGSAFSIHLIHTGRRQTKQAEHESWTVAECGGFLFFLRNDPLMRPFVICGVSKPKQSTPSLTAQDEEKFQPEGLYINTPTHAYRARTNTHAHTRTQTGPLG